jgi:hypothetical protein
MGFMRSYLILILIFVFMMSPGASALKLFSGPVVNIDSPVDDDVFAAGNVVNINAPVASATVAGGTLNINAPVGGDLFAAGGQVFLNSNVSGKAVLAGGDVNFRGTVGRNAVVTGGQVHILPGAVIGRDAFLAGGDVYNGGKVVGNLTVRANTFQNPGSAGSVDFRKVETNRTEAEQSSRGFSVFGLLMILGYLIIGLILIRYLPGLFIAIDSEIRDSPLVKTVVGFVLMIAAFIAILIVAITVIGLPIALIAALLLVVALMLTGTFVSFSLGRWIGARLKLKYGDMALFVIGFVILNILFILPYVGGLIGLISLSLGFGAILYAARKGWPSLEGRSA